MKPTFIALLALCLPLMGADKEKPLPKGEITPASLGEELPFKWLDQENRLALAKSLVKFFEALDTIAPDPTPNEIDWAMEESAAVHKLLKVEENSLITKEFSARMLYLTRKREWNIVWFNMHVVMMKENAKKLCQPNLSLEEELFYWGRLAHSLSGQANNVFEHAITGLRKSKILVGNHIKVPFASSKPHPLMIENDQHILDLYGVLKQMGHYISSEIILMHLAKKSGKYAEHYRFEVGNVPEKFMTEKLKAQYQEAKKNSFKSSFVKMQELTDMWEKQKSSKPIPSNKPIRQTGLTDAQIDQLVREIKNGTYNEESFRKILDPKNK